MELYCRCGGEREIRKEIFRDTNQFRFHYVHHKTKSTEFFRVAAVGTYIDRTALNS